jgi:hypothetical protein
MSEAIIIGCGKSKAPLAAGSKPVTAAELYTGPLFQARLRYATRWHILGADDRRVFILSALHGLIDRLDRIKPYDFTVAGLEVAELDSWAARACHQASLSMEEGSTLELHLGAAYAEPIIANAPLFNLKTTWPTKGMTQGMLLRYYSTADRIASLPLETITGV